MYACIKQILLAELDSQLCYVKKMFIGLSNVYGNQKAMLKVFLSEAFELDICVVTSMILSK